MEVEQALMHLRSKLWERIESLKEHAGAGKCKSFEEYSHVCGQIRGLNSAVSDIVDLSKNYQEDDDD